MSAITRLTLSLLGQVPTPSGMDPGLPMIQWVSSMTAPPPRRPGDRSDDDEATRQPLSSCSVAPKPRILSLSYLQHHLESPFF